MMNARFWTFANDGWVKITLKPDQHLSHHRGGPTDEGWYSRDVTWHFDGEFVRESIFNDGADCDGRMSDGYEHYAHITALSAVEGYSDTTIMRPDWQAGERTHRDYQAEAAGY